MLKTALLLIGVWLVAGFARRRLPKTEVIVIAPAGTSGTGSAPYRIEPAIWKGDTLKWENQGNKPLWIHFADTDLCDRNDFQVPAKGSASCKVMEKPEQEYPFTIWDTVPAQSAHGRGPVQTGFVQNCKGC